MANYPVHFFTEPQKLVDQTPDKKFGPISNTSFRITSGFSLKTGETYAKAFATFAGNVMLFDNYTGTTKNEELVNLVLWPASYSTTQLNPGVKFIVYRGLKRSDFMKEVAPGVGAYLPIPDAPSNTDFVKSMYANFKKVNGNRLPDTTDDLEKLYAYIPGQSTLIPLWNFFIKNPPLALANKGVWLGNFTAAAGVGIDFFLDESKVTPTIQYALADKYAVVIGNFNTSALPGQETYDILSKREQIKNYIDPCVFYHLYRQLGIGYEGLNGAFNFNAYYAAVSKKFSTCNSVYLDIRNNNDYSLNYYHDNEGLPGNDNLKMGLNTIAPTPRTCYTKYWPIIILDDLDTATSTYSNAASISLIFNCQYNRNPALYVDFAYTKSSLTIGANTSRVSKFSYPIENAQKFDDSLTVDPTTNDTPEVTVYIPCEEGTGTSGKSIAFLVKLYWLRDGEPQNITLPPSLVLSQTPFDNIFGDVSSVLSPGPSISSGVGSYEYPPVNQDSYSRWELGLAKKFMPTGEGNATGRMVQTGVGFSNNDVTFFATELDKNSYTFNISRGLDHTIARKITSGSTKYDEFKIVLEKVYDSVFVKKTVNGSTDVVYSLEPKPGTLNGPDATAFYSLSFSKDEIVHIHEVIRQEQFAGAYHKINFAMDLFKKKKDPFSTYFYGTGRLKLNGMDANGTFKQVDLLGGSNSTPVDLFFRTDDRKNYFSEKAFYGSSTDVREKEVNPNVVIPIKDYITLVQKVEAAFPDETCSQILTRIRSHYYGFNAPLPTKFKKKILEGGGRIFGLEKFDAALPASPRWQAYMGINYSVPVPVPLPPPLPPIVPIKIPAIDTDSFKKITTQGDENAIAFNPSPYISDPSGELIDVGHLLYGLDGLIVDGNYKSTGEIFKKFQIYRSNDLTGYIADVFIPAAESRVYKNGSQCMLEDLYYPNNNDLLRLYEISAPDPDLYSDVDPFGLWNAYKHLCTMSSSTNVKLSEVLAFYYDGSYTPSSPVSTRIPPNYKYRWLNFCIKYDCTNNSPEEVIFFNGQTLPTADSLITQYQGFVALNGGTQKYEWIATSAGEMPSTSGHISITNLRIRGEIFAHFWYQQVCGALLYSLSLSEAILFIHKLLEQNNPSENRLVRFERPGHLTITGLLGDYLGSETDSTEVDYCINEFITWVQDEFTKEKNEYHY